MLIMMTVHLNVMMIILVITSLLDDSADADNDHLPIFCHYIIRVEPLQKCDSNADVKQKS